VLRIGVPILQRLWDTEDQLLREQSELLHEVREAAQKQGAAAEQGGDAS
jgi:TfoX/Sxy family transcriptional regulator of competence genes